jgi:hypothetical protein
MRLSLRPIGLPLLAAVLFCFGCGGSLGNSEASSSRTVASVKGKVIFKGKPLAKAEIRFNSANINRKSAATATATIGDDGSYEVSTLVGHNIVTLGGRALGKNTRLQYTVKSFEVKEGENTFDVLLQ